MKIHSSVVVVNVDRKSGLSHWFARPRNQQMNRYDKSLSFHRVRLAFMHPCPPSGCWLWSKICGVRWFTVSAEAATGDDAIESLENDAVPLLAER